MNTNGNANQNWNNQNNARVLRCFEHSHSLSFGRGFTLYSSYMLDSQQILLDIFDAYYDARRNKRTKHTSIVFELSYESHLLQLHQELINKSYVPWKSTCFIIHDPVKREVFAANFRDRIVHHLIYNYIYDIFDTRFINDSYSCRVGKWTHYGVQRVDHFIRSCSRSYTKNAYILKLDVKGFFMSIDKHILWNLIQHRLEQKKSILSIDFDRLSWLIEMIVFHDPTCEVVVQSKPSDRMWLPSDKSLFQSWPDIWLAIWNLTSQLFANIYLHHLDVFVKKILKCKYYGRYVDDFILIDESKEYLKECIPRIRKFLLQELWLTLHPKKIYLQDHTKGVKFLGAYIKPYRTYIHRRTLGSMRDKMYDYTICKYIWAEQIQKSIATLNSYLGMMKHYSSYNIRKKILKNMPPSLKKHIYPSKRYTLMKPMKRVLRKKELQAFITLYKDRYHALWRATRL
jgi:hypothetical protein